MTPLSEVDRVVAEQIAGTTLPKAPEPLPLKDATPPPEFKPRPGKEL